MQENNQEGINQVLKTGLKAVSMSRLHYTGATLTARTFLTTSKTILPNSAH